MHKYYEQLTAVNFSQDFFGQKPDLLEESNLFSSRNSKTGLKMSRSKILPHIGWSETGQ